VSAGEFDVVGQYYQPDIEFLRPNEPPLKGQDAVIGFLSKYSGSVRETMDIKRIFAEGEELCVSFTSTFVAVEEAPDFMKPLKKGDNMSLDGLVLYELKDGLILRIRLW